MSILITARSVSRSVPTITPSTRCPTGFTSERPGWSSDAGTVSTTDSCRAPSTTWLLVTM